MSFSLLICINSIEYLGNLLFQIEGSDDLWESEILSNGARNSDLINMQIGIRRDDGTSGEIHSLSH